MTGVKELQYIYRVVKSKRSVILHCTLSEIFFDMVGLPGGWYLRLEKPLNPEEPDSLVQKKSVSVQRKDLYLNNQFSYNPLLNCFNRELRDQDNLNINIDKYLLMQR